MKHQGCRGDSLTPVFGCLVLVHALLPFVSRRAHSLAPADHRHFISNKTLMVSYFAYNAGNSR